MTAFHGADDDASPSFRRGVPPASTRDSGLVRFACARNTASPMPLSDALTLEAMVLGSIALALGTHPTATVILGSAERLREYAKQVTA